MRDEGQPQTGLAFFVSAGVTRSGLLRVGVWGCSFQRFNVPLTPRTRETAKNQLHPPHRCWPTFQKRPVTILSPAPDTEAVATGAPVEYRCKL